jgi:Bacterial Ig-like domain (group 2)
MLLRRTNFAFLAVIFALALTGCAKGPQVTSISVTPATGTQSLNAVGQTVQFEAFGTFQQGTHPSTSSDITDQVVWESSETSVATIGATGLATAVGSGTTIIKARMGGVFAISDLVVSISSSGGGGGVGLHNLTAINVTPATQTVNIVGQTAQFLATGVFDSSPVSVNLTNSAAWTSSAPSEVSIGNTGLATVLGCPVASCSVTISASATDANSTTRIGSATLIINPTSIVSGTHELTTLTVIPSSQTLNRLGETAQFIALGTFSSSPTTQDLAGQVVWTSSDTSVATIDPITGAATAQGCGATSCLTTITATGTAQDGATVIGTAALTVIPGSPTPGATLTNITIIPGTGTQTVYAVGQTAQFLAIGTYANSATVTKDITNQVTWGSTDRNLATIDASGLATAGLCTSILNPPICTTAITASFTDPVSLTQLIGTSSLSVLAGNSGPSLPSLTVYLVGAGTGTVTSSPAGINACDGTSAAASVCTAFFPVASGVTLTATPTGTATFGGWSSNCVVATPTTCTVLMNGNQTVGAIFN